MLGLKIDGKIIENEYTLDLNTNSGDTFDFEMVSTNSNGSNCRWAITYNADMNSISTERLIFCNLRIIVSLKEMTVERFLVIENVNGDRFTLILIPNAEEIRPKEYTFKLGKTTFEKNVYTFNIISKELKYKLDWDITYDGHPLPINVSKMQNKLVVGLLNPLAVDYTSEVVLVQQESFKELHLKFKNTNGITVEYIEE